jgi:hypothetical protein
VDGASKNLADLTPDQNITNVHIKPPGMECIYFLQTFFKL